MASTKDILSKDDLKDDQVVMMYGPKCELWCPFLHDVYPPRSRVYNGPIPTFKPPKIPIPNPKKLSKKRPHAFSLQDILTTTTNVTRTPSTTKKRRKKNQKNEQDEEESVEGDLKDVEEEEEEEKETKEDEKDEKDEKGDNGEKRVQVTDVYEKWGWDFQYRPGWSFEELVEGEVGGDFGDLALLLDGANLIYSMSGNSLFGLLRASTGDVTDLSSYTWAPHTDINDPTIAKINPLRPIPTDPYYKFMSPELAFLIPQRNQVEAITKPTLKLPPDPLWTPKNITTSATDVKSKDNDGSGSESDGEDREFSQGSGASEYNSEDTPEQIRKYLSSQRWKGCPTVTKMAPPYFRDARMIHWMHKSISICGDLKIDDLALNDLVSWNKHQPWWNHPDTRFARNHIKPPRQPPLTSATTTTANKTPTTTPTTTAGTTSTTAATAGTKAAVVLASEMVAEQIEYTWWHGRERWLSVADGLEYETRLVADLLTVLHYHRLGLTCNVKRWSRFENRYNMKWESISVRYSTPSLLQYTTRAIIDPTLPADLLPPQPERKSRISNEPKPVIPPKQADVQKNLSPKTYNVVCAVAVSNLRRSWLNGEWCESMFNSGKLVSMVGCLIINAQHPTGTMKFFTPSTNPLASHLTFSS